MNYSETLAWLYAQLPMFTRVGAAALKLDLTKTLALAEAAGNPHQHLRCIHIAGTNGKGSVSHSLAAIFQAAGYKTGLYTSPHLNDFRERIRINGVMIPEEHVVAFISKYESVIQEIQPSFFEATMIMAFDYFASEQTEIAIIETGMGGRLDSSNIITPLLSVITNIGLDHVQFLGDTLPLIAAEKAGIIKTNVPVVIGESHILTAPVFEAVSVEKNAPLIFADKARAIMGMESNSKGLRVTYSRENIHDHPFDTIHHLNKTSGSIPIGSTTTYFTDLPGIYQAKNMATVLAAIDIIKDSFPNISAHTVAQGLAHVKSSTGLMGRWEVLQEHPLTVIDVGHNADGIQQILQQLNELHVSHLHLVFGMVHDKDITTVLQLLPKHASYYFTQAQIPRAMPALTLQEMAGEFDLKGTVFSKVSDAVAAATSAAAANDLVLIFGSVFVIAEVDRNLFSKQASKPST